MQPVTIHENRVQNAIIAPHLNNRNRLSAVIHPKWVVWKKRSPVQKRHNTRTVLGIDISILSWNTFLRIVEEKLKGDKHQDSKPLFVATVNPEFIISAQQDREFRDLLNRTGLNTADGSGICLALNRLYQIRQPRITGSDSMEKICRLAEKHHKSVFLLGAAYGVAEKAADKLIMSYPKLTISGVYSPKNRYDALETYPDEIQQQLRKADVIFVALGAPAQEKWIDRHLGKLPACKVALGIGGTLDFIAGEVKRAPQWMQAFGLEWLFRLLLNPSRWRRMLKIPIFIYQIFREWLRSNVFPSLNWTDQRSNEARILWQIPQIDPGLKRS